MPSWIGLDMGERRIGVAVADESTRTAVPLTTLEIRGKHDLLTSLTELVEAYHVTRIIVGLPKTLKGEIGPSARKVMTQVEWLKTHIDRPWIFWDERLSTQEVDRILMSAEIRASRRKSLRDKLAAQRILQSYMDSQGYQRS